MEEASLQPGSCLLRFPLDGVRTRGTPNSSPKREYSVWSSKFFNSDLVFPHPSSPKSHTPYQLFHILFIQSPTTLPPLSLSPSPAFPLSRPALFPVQPCPPVAFLPRLPTGGLPPSRPPLVIEGAGALPPQGGGLPPPAE